MPQTQSFLDIALLFDGELRALHEFNRELGARADSLDHDKRKAVVESLTTALGMFSPPVTPPSDSPAKDSEIPGSLDKPPDILAEKLTSILTQPDDPRYERVRAFYEAARRLARVLPSHGAYLRRGILSNLTTTFEILLARLLQDFYVRYPGALKAEDRTLSLADLRACGTIDSAERLLIQREVDSLLFKPFDELLNTILRRFSLSPTLLEQQQPILEELFLRRNLFVHNLGVVNRHYLSKVPKQLFPDSLPQEGSTLPLNASYLAVAIDTVLVAGLVLLQALWLKWEPEECTSAHAMFAHLIYESLADHQYSVVIALAQYASTFRGLSDFLRKVILVNHAIALRELNNHEGVRSLLAGVDWSSAALRFQAAVKVLEGRYMSALEYMKKALAVSEITAYDLQHWPLFDPMRTMPEFQALLVTARVPGESR